MNHNNTPIVPANDTTPFGLRRAVMLWVRKRIQCGAFTVNWPDGKVTQLQGAKPGPSASITVHRWRAVRRFVFGGTLGLAEAYIDGDWDSPDLSAAVELGALHQGPLKESNALQSWSRFTALLRHRFRPNTKRGSKRNIAEHYDLGNAFYEAWLDPTMTYSSAVFQRDGETLETGQHNKYRRLLDISGAKEGDRVLEIGCGWGGFASLAARERGVNVTAVTISKEQHDYAAQRVYQEGLAEKIDVQLRDYRDLSEKYDHIASIEMFEAVGEKYWPAYFTKIREALAPGGRAALQIITIDDTLFPRYRRSVDFIQSHVFPGGMLPSRAALADQFRKAGLALVGDDGFGQHYARTLAEWHERFQSAWPRLTKLGFDERFRRLWTLYLAYCEGGFRAGNIDVRQIALKQG